jgi:catechol 2,3-dioxygenase-like lactoylglutathione lyase family enzyme
MEQPQFSDNPHGGQYSTFGLQFHHLGLAVKEPAEARRFLEGLGYRFGGEIFDPLQNVNVMMCYHDTMPAVEIIFPASAGQGPVTNLLATHKNGLIYHLCFRVDNLSECLTRMEAAGIRLFEISPPQPAVLFGGDPVSFYMVPGMGVIEIIEGLTGTSTQ